MKGNSAIDEIERQETRGINLRDELTKTRGDR